MKFSNPKARETRDTEQAQVEQAWAELETATSPVVVEAMALDVAKAPEPAAALPAVALTPDQLAALIAAVSAGSGGGLQAGDLAEVIRQSRKPIPENEVHSGVSIYRPDGHAVATPEFRWPEVWWAAVDEKGDAHPLHPFDWERCTVREIEAVNSLIPGVRGKIEFVDGSKQDVAVIEERTTAGEAKRLLIGFNFAVWKDRTKYNSIGRIVPLCAQLRELAGVAA